MDSPATAASPPRRKPLKAKNSDPTSAPPLRPKPKLIAIRIPRSIGGSTGKENRPILSPEHEPEPEPEPEPKTEPEPNVQVVELREASLGEELEAIRKSRERLREERERTEKELREKDAALRRWEVELQKWAEEQRNLELELRLLIKLRDLRSSSMMSSPPFQSFREEEQLKNMQVLLQVSSPVKSLREKEWQKSMETQLQVPESAEETSEVDEASSIQEIEAEI